MARRIVVALSLAIAALAAGASPAAAGHVPGGTYSGNLIILGGDSIGSVGFSVSNDGDEVVGYSVKGPEEPVLGAQPNGADCDVLIASTSTATVPIVNHSFEFKDIPGPGDYFTGTFGGAGSVSGSAQVVDDQGGQPCASPMLHYNGIGPDAESCAQAQSELKKAKKKLQQADSPTAKKKAKKKVKKAKEEVALACE